MPEKNLETKSTMWQDTESSYQKINSFLYTTNKHTEKEIMGTSPFKQCKENKISTNKPNQGSEGPLQ